MDVDHCFTTDPAAGTENWELTTAPISRRDTRASIAWVGIPSFRNSHFFSCRVGSFLGSKYRVSGGPYPQTFTITGSSPVRAKWFMPPGSE